MSPTDTLEPATARKQFHVVVSDPVPAAALSVLEPVARLTVRDDFSVAELTDALAEADALIVRSGTKVTAELLAKARKLRIIARAGVGVDNIDVRAATARGIIVVNSPEGNTISAAEHTVAMLLSLMRHIPRAAESMRRGEWNRKAFTGSELYKKTVGVVGLGKIGKEVATRLQAFRARILAFDPFLTAERARELDVEQVDLESLLRQADVITVHSPLTKETRGLIGREQLAMMKKGARVVNCARGGIIDEEALREALESGHLAGAALDVFAEEPPRGSPLPALDRVVATPHLGASTEEAQVNVVIDVAEQVRDVLEGRPARAAVNIPSLPAEVMAVVEPYLYLAERMGSFMAQIVQGGIQAIDVGYAGDISRHRTEPLTYAVLKGLLSVRESETVNYVNAPFIAQEYGIRVSEVRDQQPRDYVNAITVRVTTETEDRSCEGTLFGSRESRIVMLDGHRMDVNPTGHKLLTWQDDQPGVVGRIGTVLGQHNINIAEMQVGRDTPRGHALMVLSVDEPVEGELLQAVRGVPGIKDARVATLPA